MKNLNALTQICVLLFLTGCASKHGNLMKSAQANYQANQYEAALQDAVAALKLKPNYNGPQYKDSSFFR